MYLEAMHKTLKYSVYQKKKIRRMDHAIHLITEMFDGIYSNYLSRLKKPTADKKSAKVFKTHKESLKAAGQFQVVNESDILQVKNLNGSLNLG